MAQWVVNPRGPKAAGGPIGPEPSRASYSFHRRLDGYAPTRLMEAPTLARALGVGRVWTKLETERFGLPAFKILGGSWAAYRRLLGALSEVTGSDSESEPRWSGLAELREALAPVLPCRLVTATDGNHGRGVARVARLFGLEASVFVPAGTARARIEAIASEGAQVEVVDGSYDETVAVASQLAGPRSFLIQDTSWEGYEDVPAWVIEGYATLLFEIDEAREANDWPAPDVVFVPVGVGALLAAVLAHASRRWPGARIVGVEPQGADCTLRSLAEGHSVSVPGPHRSMMAGLNCGTLATIVWPLVRAGLDGALVVDEEHCAEAVRLHHQSGVDVGESGAASLAALVALARDPGLASAREALGLGGDAGVLVLVTEAVTDPQNWRRIVQG